MSKRLPYSRQVLPKDDPSIIIRERRGLREYVAHFGGKAPPKSPTETAKQLAVYAHALLRKAGERSIDEVMADADTARANDPDEARRDALLSWCAHLMARRGVLSPIALAAKYLSLQVLAVHVIASGIDEHSIDAEGDMDKRVNQIMGLCDAWHWWHMEVFQEHDHAFAGATSRKSLANGPAALRARTSTRNEVVRSCISGSNGVSSPELAKHRFKTINKKLEEANLQPFETETALAKAIQRLRR